MRRIRRIMIYAKELFFELEYTSKIKMIIARITLKNVIVLGGLNNVFFPNFSISIC